jgi:hypothetical protein
MGGMKRAITVVLLIALTTSTPIPATAGKWAKGLYAKSITDVYKVYYNRYTKGGKKGKPVLFQFGVGDFSGDGLPEIVLGGPILDHKTSGQLYTRMKTFVISPSKKGKFSLYKPMHNVMPYSDNARHTIIADFNGDNRNDLFIVDHGYDAEPFPGDQNVLVLSRGKRKFFNAKTRVPKLKDFSHGAGAGDVDGDGDIDLFIAQSRYEGSSHHYFLENRKGRFVRVPNGKWIDKSLSKIATGTSAPGGGIDRLSTAGLEDIDGDGQIDLILVTGKGEALHNTRIVFGQKGKFRQSNVVELPADRFFGNKNITRNYIADDIDGNGLKDLILLHIADIGGSQKGVSLQVLSQTKKRKFQDKTKRYIPFGGSTKKAEWSYALHLVDLNNDKRKDLVVQSLGSLMATGGGFPPRVFLQQKNKQFKPVPNRNLTGDHNWQLAGVQPVDIDGDGELELVGSKVRRDSSNPNKWYFIIQVAELTSKKTNPRIIDKTANYETSESPIHLIIDGSGRRIYTDRPERYSQ